VKPEIKKKWVDALRSGEYAQGYEILHNEATDTYCCLGVLCDLAIKDGVPVDTVSFREITMFDDSSSVLPKSVQKWAGISNKNPSVIDDGVINTLAGLNDAGLEFYKIADIIEEQL